MSPKRETSLPLPVRFLAAWIGVWLGRSQQQRIEYQREEIQLLRQKLGGRRLRFSDGDRRRLAVLGRKLGRRALGQVATVATPDTILRWYRELVAKKYDGSAKRGPGRPGTVTGVIRLLVRMARENPSWGYTRLRGALKNIGHELGRNTIKRILQEQGIDPAPTRKRRYSWETFIRAHLGAIAAADFFTVEVMGLFGLVRMYVFFVIDLASRKVEVAGICRQPDGLWMDQMARNLLDAVDGFLRGKRYLLVDRDPLVHEGVSGSSHPSRDQGGATSGEEPEPERVRGEVRAVGSQRVSRPDHSARRLALAARRLRVSEALPPGAKPSGAGERPSLQSQAMPAARRDGDDAFRIPKGAHGERSRRVPREICAQLSKRVLPPAVEDRIGRLAEGAGVEPPDGDVEP